VLGARLSRYRRDRDAAMGGRQARLQWRGVSPLVNPSAHAHGFSLGFAF